MNSKFDPSETLDATGPAQPGIPAGEPAPDLVSSTDSYAQRFAGPAGAWLLERQTTAILDMMAPWQGATVLDVGGGHAQVTPPLMEVGHRVTTLVSSAPAAERLLRITGGAAQLVIGDLDAPPLPDRSHDVVVSVRMMAHVPDWQRFLAGLCRVAGEAVIIDFPIPAGANALSPLLFGAKKKIEKDTRRYRSIPLQEVVQALAAQGFEADAHVGQFVLPMALHRALKSPGLSQLICKAVSPLSHRYGNPVILRARRV